MMSPFFTVGAIDQLWFFTSISAWRSNWTVTLETNDHMLSLLQYKGRTKIGKMVS